MTAAIRQTNSYIGLSTSHLCAASTIRAVCSMLHLHRSTLASQCVGTADLCRAALHPQQRHCKTCTAAPRSADVHSPASIHHPQQLLTQQHHQCALPSSCASTSGRGSSAGMDAPVIIAGAGIAGLATAVALHRVGISCIVLEEAPGPRQSGAAIGVWSNAWRALDSLGVAQQLRDSFPALTQVEFVRGETGKRLRGFSFSECGKAARRPGGLEFRGVRRAELLEALLQQLPQGTVRYGTSVAGIDSFGDGAGDAAVVVRLKGGGSSGVDALRCRVLVGADGARSAVAGALGLPAAKYAGYTAYRGVASYSSPSDMPVPQGTIRQVLGAGVRAGFYPISATDVYWYTCFNLPADAPVPASPAALAAEAASKVRGWSVGIERAIELTPPEGLSRSRVVDRWSFGATGRGAVTLVGDSAHPMTPNLGQGGCVALEDAVELAQTLAPLLPRHEPSSGSGAGAGAAVADTAAALRSFETARVRRCLPITLRSHAFGVALQMPYPPVTALRDAFLENVFSPAHFLDHTDYDCGDLKV